MAVSLAAGDTAASTPSATASARPGSSVRDLDKPAAKSRQEPAPASTTGQTPPPAAAANGFHSEQRNITTKRVHPSTTISAGNGSSLAMELDSAPTVPPGKLKRVSFRLDDGGLIKCNGARGGGGESSSPDIVKLSAEAAAEVNKLSHSDVLRAHRHLEALCRAGAPRVAAAHEAALAAAASGATPVGATGPSGLKRLRTDGDVDAPSPANGVPMTPLMSPGGTVVSGGDPPPPGDWPARCRSILKSVMDYLGNSLPIFDRPVDANVVKDYYKVVKSPMDLGTILVKLNSSDYNRPSEFAADVRQVWYNCKLYNKKGDLVERAGTAASMHFETIWSKSGLAESKDRSRRSNAGLAAAKFEPPAAMASKRPKGGPAASSARSEGRSKGGSKAASQRKGAVGGGKKAGQNAQSMSHELKVALAEKLGNLDETALHGVVGIIRERTQLGNDDEEIELDIEDRKSVV